MTELLFKTENRARPQRRPRVYFTCHPADTERSLDKLCADLFAAADCAVYYTADMADRLPEETRETDLERMNLFVIPVSEKLLTEPNRAMDEDFPFAREKHIPVLPILLETGLDPIYSRPDKFGALQYLDPITFDLTAVSYEEKLKKHLAAVLLDDTTAECIRSGFDAYVFLSYRKKDRKQANELMRLIHADPACQSLAVWFDEFLTPGESFTKSIETAMEKSALFALLVTPSLLERNAEGGPNYVQATEFPMARDAGMELLPAETETTDRAALAAGFPGLPAPLDVRIEEERNRFLSRLRALTLDKPENDWAQVCLLGLAYLNGVDVEMDRERGLRLVTAAAEAEQPGAMKKLYSMYSEGDGVPQDWRKAAEWAKKRAAYNRRTLGEEHPATLIAMGELADACGNLGDCKKELRLWDKIYRLRRKVDGDEAFTTLTALNNRAASWGRLGEYRKAVRLFEKAYRLLCRTGRGEEESTLTVLFNLEMNYRELGDDRKALEMAERGYGLLCMLYGEEHEAALMTLGNLATAYYDAGEYRKAAPLLEKLYALRCKIRGEKDKDTMQALSDLASAYYYLGEYDKAQERIQAAYDLLRETLGDTAEATQQALHDLTLLRQRAEETQS